MDEKRAEELRAFSSEVQKDILRMVGVARSGPFEISMTTADLLVYLYWEEMLLSPEEPRRADRDRFVTDVSAAVPALYAVLARRGFFEREHLWHYRRLGAMLQGLPDYSRIPGVDAPCITLQPALAMAEAMAGELYLGESSPRIFMMTSDASIDSMNFAEAAEIAGHGTPNLTLIILCRGSGTEERHKIEEKTKLMASFGWRIERASAVDFYSLERAFSTTREKQKRPLALFATTSADAGLSVTDPKQTLPAQSLSLGELDKALEELEVKSNNER